MDELTIQYHDFENAKKELKRFSKQTTKDLGLSRVDYNKGISEFLFGGGLGLDHKVTGEELNRLTSQVEDHLISMNKTQNKLIKEFGQVYNALESLDKDYIQSILVSIKATEETSKSIQETQGQIRKIVENQRKTLEELKKFKQKIDSNVYIKDIDKLWDNCQNGAEEIRRFSESITDIVKNNEESNKKISAVKISLSSAEKKIETLSEQAKTLSKQIDSVTVVIEKLSRLRYLMKVDDIWTETESCKAHIKELKQSNEQLSECVKSNGDAIDCLKKLEERVNKLFHIEDIDEMWKAVENHTILLAEGEQRDKEFTADFQAANSAMEILLSKVKYAYWAAGGAAILAIFELFVIFTKVI